MKIDFRAPCFADFCLSMWQSLKRYVAVLTFANNKVMHSNGYKGFSVRAYPLMFCNVLSLYFVYHWLGVLGRRIECARTRASTRCYWDRVTLPSTDQDHPGSSQEVSRQRYLPSLRVQTSLSISGPILLVCPVWHALQNLVSTTVLYASARLKMATTAYSLIAHNLTHLSARSSWGWFSNQNF